MESDRPEPADSPYEPPRLEPPRLGPPRPEPPRLEPAHLGATERVPDSVKERRSRHGGVDLLVGIALIWAFELAVGVAIFVWFLATHGAGDPQRVQEEFAAFATSPGGMLLMFLVASSWMLAVIWFLACRRYRLSFGAGFALRPLRAPSLLTWVTVGAAAGVALEFVLQPFSTGESMMAEITSTPEGLWTVTVVALIAPFTEELYYRGFIFPVLREKMGVGPAVTLTSLWFAAVHAPQVAGDWAALPAIYVMGLLWTLQRQISGSLVPSIVTHLAYNATIMTLAHLIGAD